MTAAGLGPTRLAKHSPWPFPWRTTRLPKTTTPYKAGGNLRAVDDRLRGVRGGRRSCPRPRAGSRETQIYAPVRRKRLVKAIELLDVQAVASSGVTPAKPKAKGRRRKTA